MPQYETLDSGPIQTGTWDTRTRDNCYWCERCETWLRKEGWITEEMHKHYYCKGKRIERRD